MRPLLHRQDQSGDGRLICCAVRQTLVRYGMQWEHLIPSTDRFRRFAAVPSVTPSFVGVWLCLRLWTCDLAVLNCRSARALGLDLINASGPVKAAVMGYAMGLDLTDVAARAPGMPSSLRRAIEEWQTRSETGEL